MFMRRDLPVFVGPSRTSVFILVMLVECMARNLAKKVSTEMQLDLNRRDSHDTFCDLIYEMLMLSMMIW
jgi:hypothetical protein